MSVFNFDKVEDAGRPYTSPGTIAVFDITKVEFKMSTQKNSPYAEVEFTQDDKSSAFRESFYLTEKALPRLQHVAINATGQKFAGDLNEEQIKTKLTGKKIGLKVGGRVSSNGKGYASLAFGGFAKPPAHLPELSFTAAEQVQIDGALKAIANSQSQNADSEGSESGSAAGGAAPSGDDAF